MKGFRVGTVMSLMLGWLAVVFLAQLAWGADGPRMTKEELKPLLGNPDVIVIDVRIGASWSASKWKIQGAVREDPRAEIEAWAKKYPKDKTIVLYCS
jgi:predicted sulfurtransferase